MSISRFSALGSSELRCESDLHPQSQPTRWLAGWQQLGGAPSGGIGPSAASGADPGGGLRETWLLAATAWLLADNHAFLIH